MDSLSNLNKIHYEYFKQLIVDGRIKYSIDLSGKKYINEEENLVQISRYLWYFSAANVGDTSICNDIYDQIISVYQVQQGQFKWSEDDEDYHLYGLSFVLFAFTEYYKLCGLEEVKVNIIKLVDFIESEFYDVKDNIYNEQLSKQLTIVAENKIGNQLDAYTANSMIHLLESYTNLCVIDESYIKLLKKIVFIIIEKFYSQSGYFFQYLNKKQEPINTPISYGHDIETMWLLIEALETCRVDTSLFQDELLLICKNVANKINCAGYMPVTSDSDNSTWWAISEAAVGFYIADRNKIFNNTIYLQLIHYFKRKIYQNGYAINSFNEQCSIIEGDIANCWKTPYHDGRMLLKLKGIEGE